MTRSSVAGIGPKIKEIEALIVAARHPEAHARLARLVSRPVPRNHATSVAGLARRLRRPDLGLRCLHRYVRTPHGLSAGRAPAAEKLEYGACLVSLGAVLEAEELLSEVPSESHPKAHFFRALACFPRWDYESAIPLLERFLEATSPRDYDYLVGQVNLVAAWTVVGRTLDARLLIEKLLTRAKLENLRLLEMNLNELKAQCFAAEGNWARALEHLERTELEFGGNSTADLFFVRKWRAVALARLSPRSVARRRGLERLRDQARAEMDWETVRDCELHLAIVKRDKRRIEYLVAGTPFPEWRRTAEKTYRALFSIELPYTPIARILGKGPRVTRVNGDTGQCSSASGFLKPGQVQQRLFRALNRDFFRPLRLVELFTEVFPRDYFSPASSEDRIYQSIRRLRAFFRREAIPLEIAEMKGSYRLVAKSGHRVVITFSDESSQDHPPLRPDIEKSLRAFRVRRAGRNFRLRDFLKVTASSRRTAIRHLTAATQAGVLRKTGAGAAALYQF